MNFRKLVFATALVCGIVLLRFYAITRSHGSSRSEQHHAVIRVGFQVGERAPDFELRSLDGRSLRLSELSGKPVLLNYWATWCAPCRIEMPWLVELDEKYRAQGLQIVGVSMDDASAAQQVVTFVKERGVNYEILLGNSATADAYGGVRFMPQSFFLDADGQIIKATTGLTDKKDLEDASKTLLAGHGVQRPGARPEVAIEGLSRRPNPFCSKTLLFLGGFSFREIRGESAVRSFHAVLESSHVATNDF